MTPYNRNLTMVHVTYIELSSEGRHLVMLEQLRQDLLHELCPRFSSAQSPLCGTKRDKRERTRSGWAITSCRESEAQYITSGHG